MLIQGVLMEKAKRLAGLVLDFGKVNRVTMHQDGVTFESDTTHTVMLGIIACELSRYEDGLMPGLIAQYALVHDLIETKTGDVNTLGIGPEAAAAKKLAEAAVMKQLQEEYADCIWMLQRLGEYEKQFTPEARFIRLLDKVLPKLTHALNHGAAVRAMGMTREALIDAHERQYDKLVAEYPEFEFTLAVLSESMGAAVAAYKES